MTREIKAEQYQGRWANREILIIFSYTLFQMFLFATKLLSQTLMIRLTTKCLWVGAQEREREGVCTCSLSSWRYLATAPNAKSSTFTKLDPAKSKTAPSSMQMPTCPMKGANHDTTGSGVQTIQHGNFAFFESTSSNGQNSCRILWVELVCSAS